jgi:type IV pilus assembly protein PilY1
MSITRMRNPFVWALVYIFVSANTHAALTDIANVPLASASSTAVKPNILFTMDNSGSMDWAYLPDWANTGTLPLFRNAGYNGAYYDPAVTYTPPVFYTAAGLVDTAKYPSQTAANSTNWTSVKNDAYEVQDPASSNLTATGFATYYTFIPGEHCDNANLRTCVTQATPIAPNDFPAKLRWCSDTALTNCQAARIETGATLFTNPRYPGVQLTSGTPGTPATPATATISITGTASTAVSSIKVNGFQILAATTAAAATASAVATNIRDGINACTAAIAGSCQIAGYSASRSGSTVTITAPITSGSITFTPIIVKTGTDTFTIGAFGGFVAAVPAVPATFAPGSNLLTTIQSSTTSYPYPGQATKSASRTDCAGTTCNYAEEMTNFANWWSYYHTRMQLMKTSATIAFSPLDVNYRVGFYAFNNGTGNVGTKFVNVGAFDTAQKNAWYAALLSIGPGNTTPLRTALSTSGRLFAGKLTTLQGVTVVDPMQYSCQQNFTIAATDGYWNEANPGGYQVNGTDPIGDQDGGLPRPFKDSGSLTTTTDTLTTTVVKKQSIGDTRTSKQWGHVVKTTTTTACSGAALLPTSCAPDTGGGTPRTWCMTNSNSAGTCSSGFGSGNPKAFGCRGSGSNPPTGGTPCVNDGNGNTWCIYPDNSTSGTTSCTRVGSSVVVCKPPTPPSGVTQNQQNQVYTETITGSTTSIDNYTTTDLTRVVAVDGTVVSTNTSRVSTDVKTNVSTTPGAVVTDTGDPNTTAVTWTNSGAATTVCVPSGTPNSTTAPTVLTSTTTATGAPTETTLSTTGPTVGPPMITSIVAGATPNTLADVAAYYYSTDLRQSAAPFANCTGAVVSPATVGNDVCKDNLSDPGVTANPPQRMTTFTIGLGASGYMQYSPTYLTDTSGDFFDVKNGTLANPATGVCSWQASGKCNWPTPIGNTQTTIDDLWHAAVNGRGVYFSATNPTTLASGLSSALAGVNVSKGTAAAATTSNPNVTTGDNFVFSTTFNTVDWDGEAFRQELSLTDGKVSITKDWTAQAQLSVKAAATAGGGSRRILTRDAGGSNGVKDFTFANLTATEQAYFAKTYISTLSQFCTIGPTCLSSSTQTAAAGQPLVEFLRGDRSHEGVALDTTTYYRNRVSTQAGATSGQPRILGDIVNAEALYVKTSPFDYGDAGYSAFKATNATRQGMVYIAANDGMLHALYAGAGTGPGTGGAEAWAYVPNLVLPKLYKLADKNYANLHTFLLDGTPVSQDVFFGGAWHTIVVGGQNSGGRGYYALDVTDPATPVSLWEFTDTNMGYTFGNPEIVKLKDGTWVVLVTSGYNNVSPGDGVGRLYVLNAQTGALIRTISTGVGTTTTPSGLGKVRAWVDNATTDNTAQRAYSGDMLGNVWRFDVNGDVGAAGYDAQLLVTLTDSATGGNPQPITTKPELGDVAGTAVVFVGTGRYLGVSDLGDTKLQSFYAIKDSLGSTTLGNPRATATSFVKQVQTVGSCPLAAQTANVCTAGESVRTSSANAVNFATDNGWYLDLPASKERANTDPTLALGTLAFNTNIPGASACVAGGTSNAYFVDYRTGGAVSTAAGVVSVALGSALATRPVIVRLPDNTIVGLTRMSNDETLTRNIPIGDPGNPTRRISWRELTND